MADLKDPRHGSEAPKKTSTGLAHNVGQAPSSLREWWLDRKYGKMYRPPQ